MLRPCATDFEPWRHHVAARRKHNGSASIGEDARSSQGLPRDHTARRRAVAAGLRARWAGEAPAAPQRAGRPRSPQTPTSRRSRPPPSLSRRAWRTPPATRP